MMSVAKDGLRITSSDTPPAGWDEMIAGAAGATFFHTSLWHGSVSRRIPGAESVWISAERGGCPIGGLPALMTRRGPLRIFSSCHVGTNGGPVVNASLPPDERRLVASGLLAELERLARGPAAAIGISLAAGSEHEYADIFGPGWKRTPVPVAVIPLAGGLEKIDSDILKMNRRNERNRSLRRGCTVDASVAQADLEAFWPIYVEAAARWGVEPTPRELMSELLEVGEGRVFLTCVRLDGEMLGAHFNMHFGDRVTAWIGATSRNRKDIFPGTMVVWGDLQESCARGASCLDLGGSGGQQGVANFKRLLGAETEERGFWSRTSLFWRIAGAGRRLLRGRVR